MNAWISRRFENEGEEKDGATDSATRCSLGPKRTAISATSTASAKMVEVSESTTPVRCSPSDLRSCSGVRV